MKNASTGKPLAQAMAFYHQDGLPAAWQQALKFAGNGGRLATMPDIVAARLETKTKELPWTTYFTTLTAEYLGYSKAGNRILIVAHGIGPMAMLDGALKAYSWTFKDKDRDRTGGRITAQEFLRLEAGEYGEVSIIDFDSYCKRYTYPFHQQLRFSQAIVDPVLKARCGPKAEEYVVAHARAARMWHRDQEQFLHRNRSQHKEDGAEGSDPFIIGLEDAANCSYAFGLQNKPRPIEEGYAVAHLISTGALNVLGNGGHESFVADISCHEWNDGVRIIGMRSGGDIRQGLRSGPDARELLRNHWRSLFLPARERQDVGFYALVLFDDRWFTQYPKIGERSDTWEPEFLVTSAHKIGTPALFRTTASIPASFQFGIKEVQAMAPPEANAYFFCGKPRSASDDNFDVCEIQFYRIEVDTSKRLMRASLLARDYDTMMDLISNR